MCSRYLTDDRHEVVIAGFGERQSSVVVSVHGFSLPGERDGFTARPSSRCRLLASESVAVLVGPLV